MSEQSIAVKRHTCGPYAFEAALPRIGSQNDQEQWRAWAGEVELPALYRTLEDAMQAVLPPRSDSGSAGAPRAMRLEDAKELLDAEAHYRHQYESHGGSHIETGRAWDRMRNAAAHLRAALHSPRPKEE